MTNPVAVRTLWTQIMDSKYQFSIKRARSPKRNDDSRSGSGNVQNKIRTYCHPEIGKLSKSTTSMSNSHWQAATLTCLVYKVVSKRLGRLLNKLPLAKGQFEHHNKYINIHTVLLILKQKGEQVNLRSHLWRMLENQLIILKAGKYEKQSSIYPASPN